MEIRPLTGLRGLAAILVAWGHFHNEFPAPTRITLFVDLFFILSGFVIMIAYSDKVDSLGNYFRFLFVRLGRVYPVHIFTLALSVLAIGFVNTMRGNPLIYWRDTEIGLVQNIFLVQAWPPFGAYSWNMPAWSISAEWAAYLLFPLFLFLATRLKAWFILPVLVGWIGFYFLRDASTFGPGYSYGVHRCLLGFSLGMWLAMLRPPKILYHDGVAFAAAIAIVSIWLLALSDWYVVAPMALLILSLSGNRGLASDLLSLPPVYNLGLISYSLYMVHYPIYKIWQQYHRVKFVNGMELTDYIIFGGLLTFIVLFAAYAMWVLIEEPARQGSKRLAKIKIVLTRPDPAP